MYEHTAEMGMMNLVCDGLRDCCNVAGEPQYYSTIFKIDKGLESECDKPGVWENLPPPRIIIAL